MLKIKDASMDTDIGGRDYMEDRAITFSFGPKKRWHVFCVADGHGGEKAAEYVVDYLRKNVSKWICEFQNDLLLGCTHLFEYMQLDFETEAELLPEDEFPGSTITGCIIDTMAHKIILYNLGDSQTVMYQGNELIFATLPHTARSANERKIIEKRHPSCKFEMPEDDADDPRLYGLNLSRAFGNLNIPKLSQCLNRDIDFTVIDIDNKSDVPLRFVIASDGLWDDFSPRALAEKHVTLAPASTLVALAKSGEKGDNVAVITFTVDI